MAGQYQETKSVPHISVAEGLLTATFLILFAASAALVISMGALALFDAAFTKKKPSVMAEEAADSGELELPVFSAVTPYAKFKPKHFAPDRRRWRAERAVEYGADTQRVRPHRHDTSADSLESAGIERYTFTLPHGAFTAGRRLPCPSSSSLTYKSQAPKLDRNALLAKLKRGATLVDAHSTSLLRR